MEAIKIKVRGEELTLDEARELWRQLDAVFGPSMRVQPVAPVPAPAPAYPWVPPYTIGDVIPNPFEITCFRGTVGASETVSWPRNEAADFVPTGVVPRAQ